MSRSISPKSPPTTQELLLSPGEAPLATLLVAVGGSREEERRAGWGRARALVEALATATRGVLVEQAHLLSYHPRVRSEVLTLAAASFARQPWVVPPHGEVSPAEMEHLGLPLIEGLVLAVAAGRPLSAYIEAVYAQLAAQLSSGETTHAPQAASVSTLRRGRDPRHAGAPRRRTQPTPLTDGLV